MTREQNMLSWFQSRGHNTTALGKLITKFDCVITNVYKMDDITLDEMIKEAERELAMRYGFYTKQVQDGKMDSKKARYQYNCMEAIIKNLKSQRDGH